MKKSSIATNNANIRVNETRLATPARYRGDWSHHFHQGGFYATYDVTHDGLEFVMVKPEQQSAGNQLIVTVNWVAELKRRFVDKTSVDQSQLR